MYIKNNMLPDENIVHFARPHWVIFSSAISILIIAFIVLIFGQRFMDIGLSIYSLQIYEIISLLCFALALITAAAAFVRYITSEYVVTNKRILMKTGLVSRDVLELFLTKVEAFQVLQSVPGRIFDYGTIIVIGTGGTRDPFPFIPDPLGFRRAAQLEVDKSGVVIGKRVEP